MLIICNHVGSNIKKTIYRKFDKTLLEINLKYVLWSLSSILDALVHCFYKILASWHKCMAKWDKKTAVHIGFVNIFCAAAVHGDTSKKKKKFRYKTEINKNLANHQCWFTNRNSNKLYNVYKIRTQLFFQASYTTMLSFTLSL